MESQMGAVVDELLVGENLPIGMVTDPRHFGQLAVGRVQTRHRHLVTRQSAGFIAANDVAATQRLHGGQFLHDGIALGHAHHAERQGDGDDHGKSLRDRGHSQTAKSNYQSINQYINQSINTSINQSIHQSINQSINISIIQSINISINQSINRLDACLRCMQSVVWTWLTNLTEMVNIPCQCLPLTKTPNRKMKTITPME